MLIYIYEDMKTRDKIIKYLKTKGQATGAELADSFEISDRAVRKQLAAMLKNKDLIKIGKPPKVFYALREEIAKTSRPVINGQIKKIIEKNYFIITPSGEKKEGLAGFIYWCEKQNLPVEKTAQEYIKTLKKYNIFKKGDLINGTSKLKNTFEKLYFDDVYYLDFYAIERFGKTRLGQMLLYAKQSQNKKLIKELIDNIRPTLVRFVRKFKIDGVVYVSPTVKREVQFMNELKKKLNLKTKEVKVTKIKTEIAVPQKTLNKLNDRIENAKKTFVVEETGKFNTILIIDDAVGSGATINEIAKKIKDKKLAKKVFGLVITGSFKGFDVISEV